MITPKPEGQRAKIYSFIHFAEVTDAFGRKWVEATAKCGTIVSCGFNHGSYEVMVKGPNDDRYYCGSEGSDAYKTYCALLEHLNEAWNKTQFMLAE